LEEERGPIKEYGAKKGFIPERILPELLTPSWKMSLRAPGKAFKMV